jgi:hypothetical protein
MTTENTSSKTNPRHEKFINEMILHGDKLRAYKAAYPKATDEAARTASSRLANNSYVRKKLNDTYRQIHIGVAEDKLTFIHQELKVINKKRELLLKIIAGERQATVNEQMKAIRMDNELAEQQAILLGYGSMKPAKEPARIKNSETAAPHFSARVTKMNIEQDSPPPAEPTDSAPVNNWTGEGYSNSLPGFVTNATGYTCAPKEDPAIDQQESLSPAVSEAGEWPLLDQLLKRYGFEPQRTGKLNFE